MSEPSTITPPSSRPSRFEPQSPMKTDAGWKLCTRKPSAAPAVTAASTPAESRWRSNAITANAAAEIAHTPAASPSMPSEKLTTFMIADQPEQRQHVAGGAELDAAQERQRDDVDADAGEHQHQRGGHLAGELGARAELAPVVERADRRDQRRAAEDPLDRLRERHEQQRRHQHGGEDRQAAEQRRRLARQAALLDIVDRADAAREPRDERRQQRRHDQRDEEAEQRVVLHGGSRRRATPEMSVMGRLCAATRPPVLQHKHRCGAYLQEGWIRRSRRVRAGARRAGSGRRSPSRARPGRPSRRRSPAAAPRR